MNFGEPQFYFPKLIQIFGLESVRLAMVHNFVKLRLLESFLDLAEQHITGAFHTLLKTEPQEPELF